MAQVSVGDEVAYRGQTGIVLTVHGDDSVNLAFGDSYSSTSDGIWPVETASNVPEDAYEVRDGQSEDVGDDADDTASDGDDGDVSTEGDVVIKDHDGPDGFVDRTPVADVADDIRSGDYDDVLDAIEAAEEAGKDRDTVYDAIEDRR